ncbi:hypothetical protein [Nonomuraea monospora]|uniref:hypothetical protein n=1 Tax=Nonomuraea monospora TaxID=568818 RepID=UPI0031DED22D
MKPATRSNAPPLRNGCGPGLPPGTDPALACCSFSPAWTAQVEVHRVVAIQPGERVAVTGAAGAVGAVGR